MSNFKSGSGNLDFGGSDDKKNEESEPTTNSSQTSSDSPDDADSTASTNATPPASDKGSADSLSTASRSSSGSGSTGDATETYPYFVRRSNVGDERDTRLEIHVRDKVADQEGKFRGELAEHLGANEISKTDAREFALLAAFQNPEQVAELMRNEGFGTLS